MRIAVTYEFGMVFQHFGHTEFMKFYDVDNGVVKSSQIMSTIGNGHGALAAFLSDYNVDLLICGGIGQGAVNALEQAGITLVSGVQGDSDTAVDEYLAGKLVSSGVNCCHHDGSEGHNCGEHSCH